jgi:hypothetical protein
MAPCVPPFERAGTGILLSGVRGARVIENLVECYWSGLEVFLSTGGGNSENLIGRNIIQNNTSTVGGGSLPSIGLRLTSSSGWLVLRNTLTGNGFRDDFQAGILLEGAGTTANEVLRNVVDNNLGPGISVVFPGPASNLFERNHATGNDPFRPGMSGGDLVDNNPTVVNVWNPNNVCNRQKGPGIPPGVCNPGEM